MKISSFKQSLLLFVFQEYTGKKYIPSIFPLNFSDISKKWPALHMYLGNIMVFGKIWYFMIITVHVAITPNISNNFLYAAYIKAKENKGSILWYIQWTFHVIYKIFKVKSSINLHILLHLPSMKIHTMSERQRDREKIYCFQI